MTDHVTTLDDVAAALQLARLRDPATGPDAFRRASRRLGSMLAREALRAVPTEPAEVATPLGTAPTIRPAHQIVAVPVLRAGLGLLDGVAEVVDDVRVGMIGLARDEETLEPTQYYRNVPELAGRWVLVLEPMLATGGSATAAVEQLRTADAAGVSVLSVVATEQALARIGEASPGIRFVVAAIDPELDDDGFIVPGLGDFGDRVFGST